MLIRLCNSLRGPFYLLWLLQDKEANLFNILRTAIDNSDNEKIYFVSYTNYVAYTNKTFKQIFAAVADVQPAGYFN